MPRIASPNPGAQCRMCGSVNLTRNGYFRGERQYRCRDCGSRARQKLLGQVKKKKNPAPAVEEFPMLTGWARIMKRIDKHFPVGGGQVFSVDALHDRDMLFPNRRMKGHRV